MDKQVKLFAIAFMFCGILGFTAACGTEPQQESMTGSSDATITETREPILHTFPAEVISETQAPEIPTLTPFPDDSYERSQLDNVPDYWGDWIPEDESVYIRGVKPEICRVIYGIHKNPDEMKLYFEQHLADTTWGEGEWTEVHEEIDSYEYNRYEYKLSNIIPA